MTLFAYMESVQGFVRDRSQKVFNPEDIRRHINRARREIAMRSQCIRVVPPISGSIMEIQVKTGGTGYTNPTVVISGPDLPGGTSSYPGGAQATALASQVGGVITNVSVSFGGSGYFNPSVTITDPTGMGATVTPLLSPINSLYQNQERYNFSSFPLGTFPGVRAVFAVLDCAILYDNLRYRLLYYPFSEYQAFIRNYPFQYSYVPVVYTQLGDGTQGSLLMYPFPSQTYAFEPDCLCLPIDLQTDADYEAIGEPWSQGIPYLAASYCFEEAQAYNNSRYWADRAKEALPRYSAYARPRMIVTPYGRR